MERTAAEQGSPNDNKGLLAKAHERVQGLLASGTPGLNEHPPWNNEQKDSLKTFRRHLAKSQKPIQKGTAPNTNPKTSQGRDWLLVYRSRKEHLKSVALSCSQKFTPLILPLLQFLLVLVVAICRMQEEHGMWIPVRKTMGHPENIEVYAWCAMAFMSFLLTGPPLMGKFARILRTAICLVGTFLAGAVLYANRADASALGWEFVAWPVAVTILVDLMCYLSVRQEFRLILADWPVPPLGTKSDGAPTRAQKRIEEQSHINALLAIISVVHILLVLAISYVMMLVLLPESAGTAETVRDSVFVSIALVISSCIAVGVGVYSTTHARLLETRKEFRSTLREMQRITYELDRAADHLWKKFKKEFAEIGDKKQWVPADRPKRSCVDNQIILLPVANLESPTDENQIYDLIYKKCCDECIKLVVKTFQEKFSGRFEDQWKTTHNNRVLLAEQCKRAPVSFHDFCEDLELFDKLFRYLESSDAADSVSKGKKILSRLHLYASTYVQFDQFEELLKGDEKPKNLEHSHEAIIQTLLRTRNTGSTENKKGDLVADHPAYSLQRLWSRLQQVDFEQNYWNDLGTQVLILELSRNRGPMLNWFRASLSASRRARFQHITSEVLRKDHHEPKTVIGLRIMPTTSLQWSHILRTCGMPDKPERTASQRLKVMSLEDIDDSDQDAKTSATTGN